MTLGDWLQRQDMTQEAFAGLIEVEPATVSRYVTGQRRPTHKIMLRIFRVTNGAVSANDFLCDDESSSAVA